MDNSDKQMTMLLEEGGIADDGMNVDPVSGNEIPPGSMASEVRDDVPAQLSEGEYVVPADVLRFYGVKFFEDLRSQAKQGLMDMEQNGRIGGEPVDAPAMDVSGDLTPDEIAALASMGMAVGGMVPQPTQSTNPYLQQQQMYQQPAPVAMGNAGYNKGGLGMADTKANFDASYFARGADLDRILNPQVTQGPQLKVVTLYGPGGEVMTLTLPVQQDLYDELVQQGYSEEQVVATTETTVGVEDNDDRGGEESDTSPTGPSISEMTGSQLAQAQEDVNTALEVADSIPGVIGTVLGLVAKSQKSAIEDRINVLGLKSQTKDSQGRMTGPSFATQDIAGIATAKAMTDEQIQQGIEYAERGDDRDTSWSGGQVAENQDAPDPGRSAEEAQADAQSAADDLGVGLATGGR